ncbi:hypothetical protein JNUCC0626_40215 [Lentzea sp. JNUCC 0626]|uniref:hypothetical protein n=1 Tax=Lentzea sp. JNUCC 0626 TaxID=3367513 RepID=UPI0037478F80
MSVELAITHAYSPDQYTEAVELWERLADVPRVGLTLDETGRALEKVPAEHLFSLVMSDGSPTRDFGAVTVILVEHSDLHGSEYDATNVLVLEEDYDLPVDEGRHGYRAVWLQLGELPVVTDDDIDTGIGRLRLLVELAEGMSGDVVCLRNDRLEEYREERITHAWEGFYAQELSSELDSVTWWNADDLAVSDDEIRSLYFGFDQNDWQFNTSTDVTNDAHKQAVDHVIDSIVAAWREPRHEPEQIALPIA